MSFNTSILEYCPLLKCPAQLNQFNTTNAVEAVHRQFRKLTKTKGGFANENSLLKLLYADILKVSERWTHPVQNWNLTLSQLAIHFEGRLDEHIDL
ncbi:transposase [Thalassotalea euphylliae]|uniref:transposase n=1 Tax=Thalassotalea euphylliae TaxID=1655234 RepID=UPI0021620928|nr:transposase [Thalassotalea euphylliae]